MASKLFDQINDVWTGRGIDTSTKPDSIFMVNRFVSLNAKGFLAAVDANRLVRLPKWAALPFLKYSTPNCNAPRNKYPKKLAVAPKLNDKKKLALKRVCVKFNASDFHGKQIMELLLHHGVQLEAS